MANYFLIKTVPNWALRQYRVDIAPEEDRTFIRKKLLGMHRERLGGYLFDGTVLYTSSPITGPQVQYCEIFKVALSSIFIVSYVLYLFCLEQNYHSDFAK